MFNLVTGAEARSRRWDVIVAGSSFAAQFFILGLPRHLSVLIVEKGPIQTHSQQLDAGIANREDFRQDNRSSLAKAWVAHSIFGGNSNCWWAQTPRFHPDDFRLASAFGQGHDWPLGYDDLEGVYLEVESVMQVAGGGSDAILPRTAPFPFPPHIPTRSDVALRAASALWFAAPTARSNGGRLAHCCANGVCERCPVDAKFTILNSIDEFVRPEVALLLGAEAQAVSIEAGQARAVTVRVDGKEIELRADVIALAANGIANAAILLRSGLAAPALGRYLHEQVSKTILLDVPAKNFFGGTSITGHGYHFYHRADRKAAAAVLIENFNAPPGRIRMEKGRWTERLMLKLIAEDLPKPENRVILDGDEPLIEWTGHSAYAEAGMARALADIATVLPWEIERMEVSDYATTEAHILGTTRMGADAADSVVDKNLKTHEVRNLLALGAGAFPTCSPANPTLTLSALSLRAARAL